MRKENILFGSTMASVILGISFGIFLKFHVSMSPRQIHLLSFPGELLMNMLRMVIIPLIVSSLITGLAGLDAKSSGKMGLCIVMYYSMTTLFAMVTGLVLVVLIHPGNPDIKGLTETDDLGLQSYSDGLDAIFDFLRNVFPQNLMEIYFRQTYTDVVRKEFASNDSLEMRFVDHRQVRFREATNVIGLMSFSITFGIILGQMGEKAKLIFDLSRIVNDVILKLVKIIMWYFPIGIFFLLIGKILEIDDLMKTARALGMFLVTVVLGLIIHAGLTLNTLFFLFTRRNPLTFFRGMVKAWITAIGTDSSSATLPITFRCLEENNGIDERVTRFVLPIGATINMDGTALYEAVAAIFIAQINGMQLSFWRLIMMSITATLAGIGGSSVPSAGLITMTLVLTSVGLPLTEITFVLTLDWIIDRTRTSTNVLGDAFGAGIVHHLCRNELSRKENNNMESADC